MSATMTLTPARVRELCKIQMQKLNLTATAVMKSIEERNRPRLTPAALSLINGRKIEKPEPDVESYHDGSELMRGRYRPASVIFDDRGRMHYSGDVDDDQHGRPVSIGAESAWKDTHQQTNGYY